MIYELINWLIDYCHLPKLSNSDIISENSSVTKLCIRLIDWFINWLIDWLIDYCHLPKLSNSNIISENSSVTEFWARLIPHHLNIFYSFIHEYWTMIKNVGFYAWYWFWIFRWIPLFTDKWLLVAIVNQIVNKL